MSLTPDSPSQPTVDVIVPVYRGLHDTRLCITSVLASEVRTPFRLVVINDASPEPDLAAWLRAMAAMDQRITLLENAENLGFVKTVNRGMSLDGQNDVVLLNSDTEVANDWLDRLRAAAYSDARIATVTPFSTNATICSYPRFCEDNELPAGWSTSSLDRLFSRIHAGAMVDVPTGVGFCMYVRRECLRQTGLFDTDHFGTGYGEENDFCQRAAAAGWRNVHLLDTFVLHTGGVSFGASKQPREQAAMRMLRRLHPTYQRQVSAFVQADPARSARLAVDLARVRESGKPVILAVSHNRSGGTPRHVRELAESMADQAVFLTLTPGPGRRALLRFTDPSEPFELGFKLPAQIEELAAVLRSAGVRQVHFHHLLGHDAAVRTLPERLGVRYYFTVHDYYSYCAGITLTDPDGRYLREPGPGQCACCSPTMPSLEPGLLMSEWRTANAEFLAKAHRVLSPSHDAARRIAEFAPSAAVQVVPHTDLEASTPLPQPAPPTVDGRAPLKVLVLGALSRIKGADILEATALEAARRGAPVQFHLLGYGYRRLKGAPVAALTVHGSYDDAHLAGLIAALKPDVAWFPAQWPETYSYTLSSVLAAGLSVVVPDLGAFSERVANRPWSWIRPWNSTPTQWLDHFVAIREDHFISGTLPPLPASGAETRWSPDPSSKWTYMRDYLTGLPAAAAVGAPLGRASLEPYARIEQGTIRLRVLGVLEFLRTHALLQGVVQTIPAQWRQRVSDWLSA